VNPFRPNFYQALSTCGRIWDKILAQFRPDADEIRQFLQKSGIQLKITGLSNTRFCKITGSRRRLNEIAPKFCHTIFHMYSMPGKNLAEKGSQKDYKRAIL